MTDTRMRILRYGAHALLVECADLAEQPGDAAVALAGVLVQVGLERIQLAGPRALPAPVGEFLPGGGAGVALDGMQSPAQVPGDLPQAAPLGEQPVDERVVLADAAGVLPGRLRPPGVRRVRGWRGVACGGGSAGRFCQAGAVRGDAPLDGLGEVLPQVEAVDDLDREGYGEYRKLFDTRSAS